MSKAYGKNLFGGGQNRSQNGFGTGNNHILSRWHIKMPSNTGIIYLEGGQNMSKTGSKHVKNGGSIVKNGSETCQKWVRNRSIQTGGPNMSKMGVKNVSKWGSKTGHKMGVRNRSQKWVQNRSQNGVQNRSKIEKLNCVRKKLQKSHKPGWKNCRDPPPVKKWPGPKIKFLGVGKSSQSIELRAYWNGWKSAGEKRAQKMWSQYGKNLFNRWQKLLFRNMCQKKYIFFYPI